MPVAGKVCVRVARAIACDVRGRGEWLHRCSWPPLQLACAAYRHFAHAFHAFLLQTDRRTDITTWLHIASFAFTGGGRKKNIIWLSKVHSDRLQFFLCTRYYLLDFWIIAVRLLIYINEYAQFVQVAIVM